MNTIANAIGQAGSVANLGMLPANIYQDIGNQDWSNLGNYAGLIGAPTTLGESSGSGRSRAWNLSGGIG